MGIGIAAVAGAALAVGDGAGDGGGVGDDAPKSRSGVFDKENSFYVVDLIEIKKA